MKKVQKTPKNQIRVSIFRNWTSCQRFVDNWLCPPNSYKTFAYWKHFCYNKATDGTQKRCITYWGPNDGKALLPNFQPLGRCFLFLQYYIPIWTSRQEKCSFICNFLKVVTTKNAQVVHFFTILVDCVGGIPWKAKKKSISALLAGKKQDIPCEKRA